MNILDETYTLQNDIKIPKLGFGTWQTPNEIAAKAVETAIKDGYRLIDTATVYGNEEGVGEGIKNSGIDRSKLFLTTKLPASVKSYDEVKIEFEKSLQKLGTDYVDLYLIHAPWPWNDIGSNHKIGNQKVWKAMEEIYKSGRAKAIGVSNFNVADLKNIFKIASVKPVVDQIQYYVGYTEPNITKFAKDNHILVEAYSPLATGDLLNSPVIKTMAEKYGVSTPQIALRFIIQNDVLPLPKGIEPEHIKQNTKLDFEISDDDMKALNTLRDVAPNHMHNFTQG